MTSKDTTQSQPRPLELTEIRFARIPLGGESTSLKPCIFKTFASICGLTVEDKTGRFTRATNIELGRQAYCHPKRIGAGLVELERAGLVSVQWQGRTRTITLSSDQNSWKVFCAIDLCDPVWKQHARAFKVFAGLKRFKGRNHEAFMTNPTLARFLCMCESSVKRGFMELDDAGLIRSLTRWDGKRRSRRVVFPAPRLCLKTLPEHEGQNSPLEDRAPEHEGQNSPLEDSDGNWRNLGQHEGQNSPLVRDKTAPWYGTKQPLSEGQNSPLEDNLKRTLKKPIHTQTSRANVQGAGSEVLASVCELGSIHSPEQQANQSDLETMLKRLSRLIENQFPLKLDQIGVKKVISALWTKQGPIPAEFLVNSLRSGIDEKTVQRVGTASRNLNSWKSMSELDRASFGDEIKLHDKQSVKLTEDLEAALSIMEMAKSEFLKGCATQAHVDEYTERYEQAKQAALEYGIKPPDKQLNRIVSKYNGAERVKCADGVYRDKALPGENGSGVDASEILARRDGYSPIELHEELRARMNSLPPEGNTEIRNTGVCRKVNGKNWIIVAGVKSIIAKYEAGIPVREPEPTFIPVEKDKSQELKELALRRNRIDDEALSLWNQFENKSRKALLKLPFEEGKKRDTQLMLMKETKIEEFKTALEAEHDQKRLAILAKYSTGQPSNTWQDEETPVVSKKPTKPGLDSISAGVVV